MESTIAIPSSASSPSMSTGFTPSSNLIASSSGINSSWAFTYVDYKIVRKTKLMQRLEM